MHSPQVLVVGSFVQDLTFHCLEFPRPGETVLGQFLTGPGGKGSNQAVAAARAGGNVTFIGAIGSDVFGGGARTFQEAEGITCLLTEKAGHPTGTAGILVNSHGQNEIIVSLDANSALSPADLAAHRDAFRSATVAVGQLEVHLEAAAEAMRLARESGAMAILNPAPMRADFDRALLTEVDILIPNETEFARLIGNNFSERELETLSGADLHSLCRTLGVAAVIITLGSRGCFISQPENHISFPAMRGIRAIDSTGAGDAFVGAFATALAELGLEGIEHAARFANAAAAISVTRSGTAPAMPLRPEIHALLAQN